MSTPFAIAGVSSVLQALLTEGLTDDQRPQVGSWELIDVTVLPPDRAETDYDDSKSHVNLFLYQVAPNLGWRNKDLPSRDGSGRHRVSAPPLALDLHYLLSAYSADDSDFGAEVALGHAMQILHENPVVKRSDFERLASFDLAPPLLADSDLAQQLEQLRITPAYLSGEEMTKLWTATQAHYRPSMAYQVSVVLIESVLPIRSPLPVLTRGERDPLTGEEHGVTVQPSLVPPVPTIDNVKPPGSQPVAQVALADEEGPPIDILGHYLEGGNRSVRLTNSRIGLNIKIDALTTTGEGERPRLLQFVIPNSLAEEVAVGVYQISALVEQPNTTEPQETNHLALVVAPRITSVEKHSSDDSSSFLLELEFVPHLKPTQTASLILGRDEYRPEAPDPPDASVSNLSFMISNAPSGNHLIRLRIDGIESPIVDRSKQPPVFFGHRIHVPLPPPPP